MLSSAAEPVSYYSSCEGKNGEALLTELYHTVSEHVNVGYNGLWEVYAESDMRPDGTLWDIYSTKAWPANFTKCGNYSVVGDCVSTRSPKAGGEGARSRSIPTPTTSTPPTAVSTASAAISLMVNAATAHSFRPTVM